MSDRIVIDVHEHPSGAIGLSISTLDERGAGHGYRICGPKLGCSDATLLRQYEVDERDARSIATYLRPLLAGPEDREAGGDDRSWDGMTDAEAAADDATWDRD